MKCYKCNSKMTRKALEGVLVDACPVCEGLWLDGGELEMFQEGESKPVEEILAEAREEIKSEKRRLVTARGMCPRCQVERLEEKIITDVSLDVCSSCNGIHFDWNELNKVLQTTESKGFVAFLNMAREKLGW
jgi:Zn-finger nucleic acid-binding protein